MDALAQLTTALAGRYAVDREIGRGGMATVYLARDVRHNRKVALKVLNPELGAVLGVERFLSEIQVTANLQHPNLLPLFDSGEASGLLFYVMPFVEGESLRAKLQREKQLPIDEALLITTAVASALDYAHRHGVIHRDLKPENILMHDGQPLVADFGIALAVSIAGGSRVTQTGISLGTPHYMSPEQAMGDREVDGRSDIYSLGALAYEMLAGEPPHDGKTSQAVIAKMLTDKPRSIRLARETVPSHVEAAILQSLAKLPADRFSTAHEFADALAGKSAAKATTAAVSMATRPAAGRRLVVGALPWAVAAGALLFALLRGAPDGGPGAERALRYEIALPPNASLPTGRGNPVAISNDGGFVAYVALGADGGSRLYLRAADELQPREVPGSEGASFPFFSPDGSSVAFWSGGQVKKAAVSGGAALAISDIRSADRGSWTTTGWIVSGNRNVLVKVPARGGPPETLLNLDVASGETAQLNPVALSDGTTILYTSNTAGGSISARIGVASLEGGRAKILDVRGSYALGVLDGYLIYTTAEGTLMAIAFDQRAWTVSGAPIPLVDQVAVEGVNPTSYAYMSPLGGLVYISGILRRELVIDADGAAPRVLGDPGAYAGPRMSPDGKRVAITVGTLALRDVWIYELPSGPLAKLSAGGTINDRVEWTKGSDSVLFRSNRAQFNAIWTQHVSNAAPATQLFGVSGSQIDEGVLAPDGGYLLYQRDRTGSGELWYRAMRGDTTPHAIDTTSSGTYGARFSPDGKWIVFTSAVPGTGERVFASPFPSLSGRYQVSLGVGATPVWSADGKRIYYVNSNQLIAATIGSLQPFTIASRTTVLARGFTFGAVHADYDVARDGKTIVALRPPNQTPQLVVVRNFRAELKARLAGTGR